MISVCLVLLLGGAPVAPPPAEEAPSLHGQTIDGSREPERVPDWVVWDHFVALLESMSKGKWDTEDPATAAFVSTHLGLSAEDAKVLFRIAARARGGIAKIDAQHDAEHAPQGKAAAKEPGRAREQQLARVARQAREAAQRGLTPPGYETVDRFLANMKKGVRIGGAQ